MGHGLEVGFSLGILCKLTLFWYYRRGNLISAAVGTSRCKQGGNLDRQCMWQCLHCVSLVPAAVGNES